MEILVFLISLFASTLGAICGFGGGVIIKPIMDLTGLLPVSSVSFLSGCTALAMAVSSLIQQKNNHVELRYRTTTSLAIGAAAGGLLGKGLFEYIRTNSQNEAVLGGVQAFGLTLITVGVLFYVCYRHRLNSYHIESKIICLLIGGLLGLVSSFFGIGGGTSNVAVLFFFFSMDAKTAAKNSLYIIIFSQSASIIKAVAANTVPPFDWFILLFMIGGAVGGACIGSSLSKKFSNRNVEIMLKGLLIVLILVNTTNILKYSGLFLL